METQRELGVVGLGKMGANLSLQALEKGLRVVGHDLHGASKEIEEAGLVEIAELSGFAQELSAPRVVLLYVPAGPAVDDVLDALNDVLEGGDVLVDSGNSYWGDSMRRYRRCREHGLQFVDLGTSGGIEGARHGACFMAGGDEEAVAVVMPLLRELAVEGGTVHAGPPGAGHFVKLVHNGIEFGMLQAIAEGMDLLHHSRHRLDIAEVLRCWNHGSVIRSWLVELMEEGYRREGGMESISPYVEDTGEVNWLVHDALRMEVPVPVIGQSVMQLLASRDETGYWARAIAMMRRGFGGHPYGEDDAIRKERQRGRVGPYPSEEDWPS